MTGRRVYGFGSNRHGQIGNNSSNSQKTCKFPEVAHGFQNCKVQAVFANGDHSTALTGKIIVPVIFFLPFSSIHALVNSLRRS
jgi:alpha-tubulin suppressor-like RCC1 family protein